jgi:hypothetical protein
MSLEHGNLIVTANQHLSSRVHNSTPPALFLLELVTGQQIYFKAYNNDTETSNLLITFLIAKFYKLITSVVLITPSLFTF